MVIRPNGARLDGGFLSYVIRAEEKQILQLVTGSTVYHLYSSDMKKFAFVAPSLNEQKAVVEVLEAMSYDIVVFERKLCKAQQIKKGMMQELLTGRIRLI